MNSVAHLFDAAADHIDAFGHHKGSGFADANNPRTSPSCIIGALGMVGTHDLSLPERVAMYALLGEYVSPHRGITEFNDDPETTPEQVIETLRAVAIIAAASELDVKVVSR